MEHYGRIEGRDVTAPAAPTKSMIYAIYWLHDFIVNTIWKLRRGTRGWEGGKRRHPQSWYVTRYCTKRGGGWDSTPGDANRWKTWHRWISTNSFVVYIFLSNFNQRQMTWDCTHFAWNLEQSLSVQVPRPTWLTKIEMGRLIDHRPPPRTERTKHFTQVQLLISTNVRNQNLLINQSP